LACLYPYDDSLDALLRPAALTCHDFYVEVWHEHFLSVVPFPVAVRKVLKIRQQIAGCLWEFIAFSYRDYLSSIAARTCARCPGGRGSGS